jgi:VWFA-related protein
MVWGAALAGPSAASGVAEFRLSQVWVEPPSLTAYLEVLDLQGNLAPVSPEQLGAAVGSGPAVLESVRAFKDQGEGVAYLLLVDVSKSLSETEFVGMRQVLSDWVDQMSAKDRAAVLTFGEEVTLAADFTSSQEALKAVVAGLKPTDMKTQLHRGLAQALETARRTDQDLPRRRAIITVSDGQDDYAGGMTKQEVLDRLKVDPVPIYAIGFYRPPRKAAKEEALKGLGEFARTSGGAYFRAETSDFSQVYADIRQRIRNVYVVRLKHEAGPWDGAVRRLQMDLAGGPRAMRTGMDIRLVAWEKPPAPPVEPPPSKWWELWRRLPDWEVGDRRVPGWLYGSVILVLLLLSAGGVALLARKRRAGEEEEMSYGPEGWQPGEADFPGQPFMAQPGQLGGGDPTVPLAVAGAGPLPGGQGLKVRLSFIRKPNAEPKEFTLTGSLVIGRKPPCDLAIADDREISRKHCQLTLEEGAIQILDLGSTNGTMVNGVPISGRHRLQHDDIIRIGKTEIRLSLI